MILYSILYYFLIIKKNVNHYANKIRNKITYTRNVHTLDDKSKKSILLRYYLVNFLYFLISKIDIKIKKMQITKEFETGQKTIILDSKKFYKNNICILDTINFMNNIDIQKDNKMTHCIFQFEMINDDKAICLREYLIKYKDADELFHQTLENILLFNNLSHFTNKNTKIKIRYSKNGFIIKKEHIYDEIKDNHINFLLCDHEKK
jgi:hypothetical protein